MASSSIPDFDNVETGIVVRHGVFSDYSFNDVHDDIIEYYPEEPQILTVFGKKYAAKTRYAYLYRTDRGRPEPYTFSFLTLQPICIDDKPRLIQIWNRVERESGATFNVVLANIYPVVRDESGNIVTKLGLHTDDGNPNPIASVSFTRNPRHVRRLKWATNVHTPGQKDSFTEYELRHGTFTCGAYGTHTHGLLPPLKKKKQHLFFDTQICFTFRLVPQANQ